MLNYLFLFSKGNLPDGFFFSSNRYNRFKRERETFLFVDKILSTRRIPTFELTLEFSRNPLFSHCTDINISYALYAAIKQMHFPGRYPVENIYFRNRSLRLLGIFKRLICLIYMYVSNMNLKLDILYFVYTCLYCFIF